MKIDFTDHVVAVEKVPEEHIQRKHSKGNSLRATSHLDIFDKNVIAQ